MTKFPIGARVRFKSLEALKAQWPGTEVPAQDSAHSVGYPPDEQRNVLWWVAWSRGHPEVFEIRDVSPLHHISGSKPPPAWLYSLSVFGGWAPDDALELVALPPVERGVTSMNALAEIYGRVYAASLPETTAHDARTRAGRAVAGWIALEVELLAGDPPRKEE